MKSLKIYLYLKNNIIKYNIIIIMCVQFNLNFIIRVFKLIIFLSLN